jgi:hypothetical protein
VLNGAQTYAPVAAPLNVAGNSICPDFAQFTAPISIAINVCGNSLCTEEITIDRTPPAQPVDLVR